MQLYIRFHLEPRLMSEILPLLFLHLYPWYIRSFFLYLILIEWLQLQGRYCRDI
jgi:hypothetical protein